MITFTIALINKILRNKFNQGIKDLYNGYFKTLVKEIDRETNKW